MVGEEYSALEFLHMSPVQDVSNYDCRLAAEA
jgi:hypothetical protein